MTILGIDPGYDRLGWGVITSQLRRSRVVDFGCIKTSRQANIFDRYQQILQELQHIIGQHHPQDAAIEALYFAKNQKTALRVSEARGVIISQLLIAGCAVTEYSPQAVKMAVTGYGRADKLAVEKMIRAELKITSPKLIDDTLDALALAVTHAISYGAKEQKS